MAFPRYLTLSFLVNLICLNSVLAEVVKYTDQNGTTFFVDSVDKVPKEFKDQVQNLSNKHKVSRVKSDRKVLYDKVHYPQATSKKLEIFVADWCGYCRALEADLKKARIPYQRYNIETSEFGKKVYAELGRGGIPISRINGKTILRGYSSIEKIKNALEGK